MSTVATRKTKNRRELFALHYIQDLNGKRAAIACGYSERSAEVHASRLLRNVKVQDLIQRAMQKRLERLEIKGDDILRKLLEIAYTNLTDLFTEDESGETRLKKISELSPAEKACIKEIVEEPILFMGQEVGTRRKYKMHDKLKALELIGKHLKLFTDEERKPTELEAEVIYVAEWGNSFDEDSPTTKEET